MSSHVLKLECRAVDYFNRDREIVEHVNKFWDIETLGVDQPENRTFEEFQKSIRFVGNKYSVELPWKCDPEILPDNFSIANARLRSLYRRLSKQPERLKEYDEIICKQEEEGIIESVDRNNVLGAGKVHYLATT